MRRKPDMTLFASNLLVCGGRLRLYSSGFNRLLHKPFLKKPYLKNNL